MVWPHLLLMPLEPITGTTIDPKPRNATNIRAAEIRFIEAHITFHWIHGFEVAPESPFHARQDILFKCRSVYDGFTSTDRSHLVKSN